MAMVVVVVVVVAAANRTTGQIGMLLTFRISLCRKTRLSRVQRQLEFLAALQRIPPVLFYEKVVHEFLLFQNLCRFPPSDQKINRRRGTRQEENGRDDHDIPPRSSLAGVRVFSIYVYQTTLTPRSSSHETTMVALTFPSRSSLLI